MHVCFFSYSFTLCCAYSVFVTVKVIIIELGEARCRRKDQAQRPMRCPFNGAVAWHNTAQLDDQYRNAHVRA